jgi:hypothetical protein
MEPDLEPESDPALMATSTYTYATIPTPSAAAAGLPGRVLHAFPTMPRARPRPGSPWRPARGVRTGAGRACVLPRPRLVVPHPDLGRQLGCRRLGDFRPQPPLHRAHTLGSAGQGPPPGIEDGGVATEGDSEVGAGRGLGIPC